MAKTSAPTFAASPDLKAALAGIDLDKIPWEAFLALLKWLASQLGTTVTPDALKAVYQHCPEACCRLSCEAMELSLKSAAKSAECCRECNVP